MQQSTKRKTNSSGNSSEQVPKLKERHIVSWSQEEDDILREQIRLHGTENWANIASNFKDKTTRQCRRRWFTYLNSDFKKGGWSAEEDQLLCEAQKVYGNRWTEIAKVVSGRTDNAVKNRFSTLCKKRAKHAALAKENSTTSISLNNKRIVFSDRLNGVSENEGPLKRMRRAHITNDDRSQKETFVSNCDTTTQLGRAPLAVIGQNFPAAQQLSVDNKENPRDGRNAKTEGTFLKKDDPKILALVQQAELLTSLAAKVNSENTDESIEIAWKIFQESYDETKGSDDISYRGSAMDSYLENMRDLVDVLTCPNEGSGPSWRQPDIYEESSTSSDYSTGSSLPCQAPHGQAEHIDGNLCDQLQKIVTDVQSTHSSGQPDLAEHGKKITCGGETTSQAIIVGALDETKIDDIATCGDTNAAFDSPILETPLFRTMAAAIPSPKFTESEKQFLMRAFGMESTNTNPILSQPPACKRALLQSL